MSKQDSEVEHDNFRAWTDKLRVAARSLPELDPGERMVLVADLVAFLHEEVAPHLRIDDEVVGPGTGRLRSPLATAALAYDHLAIRAWIAKLAEAEDEDLGTLQELLYGLDALIRVHLWKEDELFAHPLGPSTSPASGT
jgi:hypothetical protein